MQEWIRELVIESPTYNSFYYQTCVPYRLFQCIHALVTLHTSNAISSNKEGNIDWQKSKQWNNDILTANLSPRVSHSKKQTCMESVCKNTEIV